MRGVLTSQDQIGPRWATRERGCTRTRHGGFLAYPRHLASDHCLRDIGPTRSGRCARPGSSSSALRLAADRPILLISAGAAGGGYTQTIVQQTLRMHNDFQAVVVCGRNDQLKSQIEGLVAFHRDRYRVLGYSNDMADLIRTATLRRRTEPGLMFTLRHILAKAGDLKLALSP
jgi:hypothetical protein